MFTLTFKEILEFFRCMVSGELLHNVQGCLLVRVQLTHINSTL